MSFEVIPAIDLMEGQVVRLVQGMPNQATTYQQDPVATARLFEQAGSNWLHVINLDGAFDQVDKANQEGLKAILNSCQLSVQFGGGLRTMRSMRAAAKLGVARLVLGTVALQDPQLLERALAEFGPKRVAVAVDLRGGQLQTHGWTADSEIGLEQYLDRLQSQGVQSMVYTDADRDGTGRGLAVEGAQKAQEATGISTIVSGGVGSLADIREARRAGLAGVIVGKALHDGVFSIEEALAC